MFIIFRICNGFLINCKRHEFFFYCLQIHSYEARIRDLENQLRNAQCDHAAQVEVLNEEKRRLRAQLQEQLDEYRDLMDVKLQLDTEIAAYRKLLESEELRSVCF